MDPQTTGSLALGAAEPPRGAQLLSARKAPSSPEAVFAPNDRSSPERKTETMNQLANRARSIPNDDPFDGDYSEEEGIAMDDDDSDRDLNAWDLPEGVSSTLPSEQAAQCFVEDWSMELKEDQGNPYDADDIQGCLSQEARPWLYCAPQGDVIYDPSWHHPPPLMPHYSKMVFENGQFDDAED